MKAMIFAAGLGTRLYPYTKDCPKALVEIHGRPMLEWVIMRLIAAGVTKMIINVHHFAGQIIQFLKEKNHFGIHIEISHEKEKVLETGGGLKKAAWFFEDGQPFFIHNTDIISTIDLKTMYQYHAENQVLATLATRNRTTSRYLLFNTENKELWGWCNEKTNAIKWSRRQSIIFSKRAFSGIHVVDPKLFAFFPEEESVFSIINTYLKAARTEKILSYPHDKDAWIDAGKPEALAKAEAVVRQYF